MELNSGSTKRGHIIGQKASTTSPDRGDGVARLMLTGVALELMILSLWKNRNVLADLEQTI